MSTAIIISHRAVSYFTAVVLLALLSTAGAKDQKMKPEELVAKHLESIGTPEARAAIKTRTAIGRGQMVFIQRGGTLVGRSEVVSGGRLMRISTVFENSPNYGSEQYVFDNNKANTSQFRPGMRANLASFAYTYDVLLREGLLGGTMTTAWALLDVEGRQPKLEYNGLKKIDGMQLHELRYKAKKGSGEVQVLLRFDPETFRHVQSEYKLTLPANMAASPTESSSQRDTIFNIREYFDNFKTLDGVTIPTSWKVKYSREGMGETQMVEYTLNLAQVIHNKQLGDNAFALLEQ